MQTQSNEEAGNYPIQDMMGDTEQNAEGLELHQNMKYRLNEGDDGMSTGTGPLYHGHPNTSIQDLIIKDNSPLKNTNSQLSNFDIENQRTNLVNASTQERTTHVEVETTEN